VLVVVRTHADLPFDLVEGLGRNESYLADPAEAVPVPGTGAVAVVLQAAAFEGGGRPDAYYPCAARRGEEYAPQKPATIG